MSENIATKHVDVEVTFSGNAPGLPTDYVLEVYAELATGRVIDGPKTTRLTNWNMVKTSFEIPAIYVGADLKCVALLVYVDGDPTKHRAVSGLFKVPTSTPVSMEIQFMSLKYVVSALVYVKDAGGNNIVGATITMVGAGHTYVKLSQDPPVRIKVEEGFYTITVVNGGNVLSHYVDCTDDVEDTFQF